MGIRVGKTVCADNSKVLRTVATGHLTKSTGGGQFVQNGTGHRHCQVQVSNTHARNCYTSQFKMEMHIKARTEIYPRTTDVIRFKVPDDKVPWDTEYPEYEPTEFTSEGVLKKPVWADLHDPR